MRNTTIILICLIIIVLIILLSVIGSCISIIQENTRGIYYDKTNGYLDPKKILYPGRHFLSPEGDIYLFETIQQIIEFDNINHIDCYTKTGVNVELQIRIQYTIDMNYLEYIINNIGTNSNDIKPYIITVALSTIYKVCNIYEIDEFSTKRGAIENKLDDNIRIALTKFEVPFVSLNNVRLINYEFDTTYKDIVSKKTTAESESVKANAERENRISEATVNYQRAQNKRAVEIIKAQGDADAVITVAKNKADTISTIWQTVVSKYSNIISTTGLSGEAFVTAYLKNNYYTYLGSLTVVDS